MVPLEIFTSFSKFQWINCLCRSHSDWLSNRGTSVHFSSFLVKFCFAWVAITLYASQNQIWVEDLNNVAPKKQRFALPEVGASAHTKCSINSLSNPGRSCNGFRRAKLSSCTGSPCTGSFLLQVFPELCLVVDVPNWN